MIKMVYAITQAKEKTVEVGGSVLWEVLIAFAVSLPFFTLGVETSLGEPFEDVFVYNNMTIMWYQTAMLVAAAVSAPIFATVSQKMGRKSTYFCINLVQAVVFIPVFVCTHESLPYTYILIGISSGGIFSTLLPFVKEITSRTRGFCLTMTFAMSLAGYQLRVFVRDHYDPMTFSLLGLVAIQMVLMLCLVESPSYLVMVGKIEHAKAALSSIKRLPEDHPSILKEIDTLSDEVSRTMDGRSTFVSLYRNKIYWDSLKMGILLFTTMELCGSLVFLDAKNACDCGIGLRNPNIIVAFVLLGSIITMITVTFCDRKYIMTFGYIAMSISLGVYAVFSLINPEGSAATPAALSTGLFLPVLLIAYGIANGLPSILIVELFNAKMCTPTIAGLYTYSQLLRLLHAHTYPYLDEYVGIHTMFYIFACINLYAGVYALFVIPNIRNKSLKQIEKQVKRIPLPA